MELLIGGIISLFAIILSGLAEGKDGNKKIFAIG
jgi:hypothetical protein